jgi:hypothetical protein
MEALTLSKIFGSFSGENSGLEDLATINFSQLAEACPITLTSLVLSDLRLTFNESTSSQSSIKCLGLSHIYLEPALAKAI